MKWTAALLCTSMMLPVQALAANTEPVQSNLAYTGVLKKAGQAGKWMKNGDRCWYQYADGTYPSSKFLKIDGSYYYFDASGFAKTGWLKKDGKWYVFDNNGVMQTGWYYESQYGEQIKDEGRLKETGYENPVTYVKGQWYYLDSEGDMKTGWHNQDGETYYLDSAGAKKTGRLKLNGKSYCFSDYEGKLYRNTWVGTDYVNGNGEWVPGKSFAKKAQMEKELKETYRQHMVEDTYHVWPGDSLEGFALGAATGPESLASKIITIAQKYGVEAPKSVRYDWCVNLFGMKPVDQLVQAYVDVFGAQSYSHSYKEDMITFANRIGCGSMAEEAYTRWKNLNM